MDSIRDGAHRAEATQEPERALSVGELARLLRAELEHATRDLSVSGEVSSLRAPESGHAYFTLRDEREDAAIDCVMYRSAPVRARKLLADGARLVLRGKVTFWPPRGRVQLVVESARPAGRGALLEALERRRAALAAEGLFALERKRALPRDPRCVGLVTSAQGAALHDIVKVAFERGAVRFVVDSAPVQGVGAADALARALRRLDRHPDVDVIIVARGGGSGEDLAAFNEEVLVRAIAAARVPVVSAVGHEVDVTLADLAADVRAATPSQAAELVVPDARARAQGLRHLRARLWKAWTRGLDERAQRLDVARAELRELSTRRLSVRRDSVMRLERRLAARHPVAVLSSSHATLARLEQRLTASMRRALSIARASAIEPPRIEALAAREVAGARARLEQLAGRLDALSPLAVLGRGYAIARREAGGPIVRRVSDVAGGDALRITVQDGSFRARVESDEPGP